MNVELFTIGDELLLGFVIDTNAAHIARTLAEVGIRVVRRGTVPDDPLAIVRAIGEALDRTGAVITTGGLGPTSDDLTIPSIAELFGRPLALDEAVLAGIEARFRALGYESGMPPGNRQQAMLPVDAQILANRHGSAPGVLIEDERGRWVATLPGVPREMRGMLGDTLLPLLRERMTAAGSRPTVVRSRTLRTTGIGESALAEALGDCAKGWPGMPLAYNPRWQGTDLRLTVMDLPPDEADARLAEAVRRLMDRCGRWVYGEDEDDLAAVAIDRVRARGWRIATAESCTGGLLGARITAIAGASDVYVGGIVAYENGVKVRELDVPDAVIRRHGAVSEAVARAMVEGVCARFGAELGLAITGIAGPGGGTPEKPVGLVWIAAVVDSEVRTFSRTFVGDREEVRLRATQAALDLVRRALS
ncbi:MAG TPA: competence/damage-inducible protein A [Gemmatimonadaceae bacterium]|nr:competence/damage-inducible protein A [Gemmatimonadaceae bacterium]